MNKYVVAYWNDHTGELLQEIVEADSALAAAVSYLNWEDQNLESMEELVTLAVNCDSMVHVLELSNSGRNPGKSVPSLFSPQMIQRP